MVGRLAFAHLLTRRKRIRSRNASATSARGWIFLALAVVGILGATGCSGRSGYVIGGPSTGQLKTSMSRLEYENETLKTQVARLKDENRTIEDKLVQEQIHSNDLVTRLDDARNALRDGGDNRDFAAPTQPRTLPAGRSTPAKRKVPTAEIPHEPQIEDEDEIPPLTIDDAPPRRSTRSARPRPSTNRAGDDSLGMRINEEDFHWAPVAAGDRSGSAPKR